MPATFEESGLRFRFPETWDMAREENPNGWTVALQSPETAFMLITYDGDMPEPELMAETALEAMVAEYQGLESEAKADTVANLAAVGHDCVSSASTSPTPAGRAASTAAAAPSSSCGKPTTSNSNASNPSRRRSSSR